MSEQEEFEFRARAEAEQAQQARESQPPAQEPGGLEQAGNFVTQTAIPVAYGLGKAAADVATQNPTLATVGAAAAFPKIAAKVPVLGPAMEMGRGAIDAMNAFSESKNLSSLSQLEHQARQYMKMGQQVPEGLQRSIDSLRTKVAGPVSAPVAPAAAPAAAPAQQGMLSRAGQALGRVGGAIAPAMEMAGPTSMFLMPYMQAAQEQAKIRQNPNMPGLENNPYAQVVRGQAATQGQAGAANQMRSVANMPYGNVSAQERQVLEQDALMRDAIRKKAFQKVMGPVAPQ